MNTPSLKYNYIHLKICFKLYKIQAKTTKIKIVQINKVKIVLSVDKSVIAFKFETIS